MKSIQEIKEELKNAAEEELPALCRTYLEDGRKGVQKLIEQAEKRQEKLQAERVPKAYRAGRKKTGKASG